MWKAYEMGHTDYIPILIRLADVLNPSKCVEEVIHRHTADRSTYSSLRASHGKFLLLLDGYDELKAPKNLHLANRVDGWTGAVKMIITSRQQYLAAYPDY